MVMLALQLQLACAYTILYGVSCVEDALMHEWPVSMHLVMRMHWLEGNVKLMSGLDCVQQLQRAFQALGICTGHSVIRSFSYSTTLTCCCILVLALKLPLASYVGLKGSKKPARAPSVQSDLARSALTGAPRAPFGDCLSI